MAGFFKNRARKRLLEQALRGRQQQGDGQQRRPVFPDVQALERVGVLFEVNSPEDLKSLEEVARWVKGKCVAGGEERQVKFSILAVGTGKCFKDEGQGESIVEGLNGLFKVSDDAEGESGITFVGKGNLSSVGVPEQGAAADFLGRKFDLLVVLDDNGNFTIEYLALKSDAAFVVGMEPLEAGHYDMVLAPGAGKPSPAEYLQQLFNYLENMNRLP